MELLFNVQNKQLNKSLGDEILDIMFQYKEYYNTLQKQSEQEFRKTEEDYRKINETKEGIIKVEN